MVSLEFTLNAHRKGDARCFIKLKQIYTIKNNTVLVIPFWYNRANVGDDILYLKIIPKKDYLYFEIKRAYASKTKEHYTSDERDFINKALNYFVENLEYYIKIIRRYIIHEPDVYEFNPYEIEAFINNQLITKYLKA